MVLLVHNKLLKKKKTREGKDLQEVMEEVTAVMVMILIKIGKHLSLNGVETTTITIITIATMEMTSHNPTMTLSVQLISSSTIVEDSQALVAEESSFLQQRMVKVIVRTMEQMLVFILVDLSLSIWYQV